MGGSSGRAVASHTPLVFIGKTQLALTPAQHFLVKRALYAGRAIHVKGRELKSVQILCNLVLGKVHDAGTFTEFGTGEFHGEYWMFTLAEGVSISDDIRKKEGEDDKMGGVDP